ncbi:PD-(D/E)XK nuclease-like domain-containing protein [Trueperella pyogenes]|uniref:PD-(D/E)XK nuclease-like domain-containing protein n=1 Tax=Trueperella pyogenes TaxID=1661 RepID=UPI00345CDC6C
MTVPFHGAGAYPDVPELNYHTGRFGPEEGSLSSTEAKRLLESPATYQWYKTHPQPPSRAFDIGHIVHSMVLGVGLDVVTYPEEVLGKGGATTTMAAKQFAAEARKNGQIPVKTSELEVPSLMAEAVLNHPTARKYFENGVPELSIYTKDDGVWMRGRIDWIHHTLETPVLIDLKTTAATPTPDSFTRTVANFHYALQREWYRHIWYEITGEWAPFMHVVVSKTPPYLVGVFEFDSEFELIGKTQMRRALTTYRACMERDEWPGLPEATSLIGPPTWYANQELDESEML